MNLTGPAPVTNCRVHRRVGPRGEPADTDAGARHRRPRGIGEFADEGLLAGQRAIPAALERAGFRFHHNTIGEALAYATAR